MTNSILVSTQTSPDNGSLQIFDLGTATLKKEVLLTGFVPASIDFALNSNILLGGAGDAGDFQEFNPNTLQAVSTVFSGFFLDVEDIEFGPGGLLYVDDNTDILQLNPQTGAKIGNVTESIPFITIDFAFGPDGNIYANDSIDNGITVFEPIGGNIVKTFPPFQGVGINDLAFNLQGVLHVIQGSEIQTVSVQQVLVGSTLTDQLVTTTVVSNLIVPTSLAFGPNGNLFVGEAGTNTVKEFDTAYNLVRTFSVNGSPTDIDFGTVNLVDPGNGSDSGNGTEGKDRLVGTPEADTLLGLGGNDKIIGNSGNDKLSGGNGNDKLFGDDGNDVLKGEAGKDKLSAGIGKNQLFGGTDRDIFFLSKGEGLAIIKDFQDGQDKLKLQGIRFNQIDIVQQGANVAISFQNDVLAIVQKIQANLLTSKDF